MRELEGPFDRCKVLLVCDNRNGLNWGCRATSLALIHILEEAGCDVTTLSEVLGQRDSTTRLSRIPGVHWIDNQRIRDRVVQVIEANLSKVLGHSFAISFTDVRNLNLPLAVKRLKQLSQKNSLARKIIEAVSESDIVVVNGEGSPIFTNPPRPDLLFQMLLLQLAQDFNKTVSYVNSIISQCPLHGFHTTTLKAFVQATEGISLVTVRDQESLELAKEIGLSSRRLMLQPDALFAIRDDLLGEYLSFNKPILSGNYSSPPEPRIHQEFYFEPHSYLCISGSSLPPGATRQNWGKWFVQLVKRIQAEFDLPLVVVQPCTGDSFLASVAKECDAKFVPVSTNIYWGSRILANCKAYITGRYHPSIMASFGGIRQIMLESNSHKTRSLQKLLGESDPTVYPIASSEETIELIIETAKDAINQPEANRNMRLFTVKELGQKAAMLGKQIVDCK